MRMKHGVKLFFLLVCLLAVGSRASLAADIEEIATKEAYGHTQAGITIMGYVEDDEDDEDDATDETDSSLQVIKPPISKPGGGKLPNTSLPQTGELLRNSLFGFGLIVIGLIVIIYYRKKRGENSAES